MIQLSNPSFFVINNKLPVYFIRSFVHLFVLLSLIIHQFLFPSFIDPDLSVFGYTLCFFILFFDSLFLFFYKKGQRDYDFFLFFLSALFFVSLTALLAEPGFLFFIFFLVFLQVFPLLIFGRAFLAFVFLLYLSLFFPLAFAWQGEGAFEERLALIVLVNTALFSIFAFSALFCFALKRLGYDREPAGRLSGREFKPSPDFLLSLNLSKRLKSVLNSLIKSFPAQEDKKLSSFFSSQYKELKQLRQFMLDFIEFAELNKKSLLREIVDMKQILNESLEELKAHKRRPENLKLDIEDFDSFRIKGSSKHLKKCFKNILINSFEALQNEKEPIVKIYCLKQKNWLSIRFLDNGHGIEEEDAKKLFEPLFSKRFGLRGLGLSYAQKVVQAHEGEVTIERALQWTKVLIKLPLMDTYYDRFSFLKMLKNQKKAA